MISSVQTHRGKVRQKNEDCFYAPDNKQTYPQLFIVADGMGGHRGGDTASKMAVDHVSSVIYKNIGEQKGEEEIISLIRDSFNGANQAIHSKSLKDFNLSGMGTTLTMGLFFEDKVYIAHVGDSRAYRVRGGKMELLTRDHSLIWQLMEEGKLSMKDMTSHPMKNVITKFLGTKGRVEPDIESFDLKTGDILLLCTDGLINMVDDCRIMDIITSNPPEKAASALIDSANSQGGKDNITVGIIKVDK